MSVAALLLLAALGVGPPGPAPSPSAGPRARPAAPRLPVQVTGHLRHKGCATIPAGVRVTVIGRDAAATADADGRFTLELPPGTYSLVLNGPGLLPDQRVDDVAAGPGEGRDLGTVEVWPAEPLPGCTPSMPSAQPSAAVVAEAPDVPTFELPGASVPRVPATPGSVWVRGGAGTGPGQFGLQGDTARDDEDALGPSTFAVGPMGSLWVLDALNARVQRFDPQGRPSGGFALPRHGEDLVESDLAVADDGHLFAFYQGEPSVLEEYDTAGRVLVSSVLPASFKGVDLVLASRGRPVFLMQNGQAVRPELGWGGIRAEGPLPGIPAGNLFARADRLDRWRASLSLSGADGRVRRSVQLHSLVPITGVRLVGVGRRGEVLLAIDRAEAGEAPRAEVLLIAVDPHGRVAGMTRAPPGNRRFEFREFALAPDGTIVQMQSDRGEVRFVRWALQEVPRDLEAGEGLVRGRVVDPGHPQAAVTVAAGRPRKAAAVAPDGTFELRLPAGTWVLSVRRAPGPGQAEGSPVELRVSVAAGAVVDLGPVVLPRPQPRSGTGVAARPSSAGNP